MFPALLAVALATLTVWGAVAVVDAGRRHDAVLALLAHVDRASAGDTIDLADSMTFGWDRAVVLPPYTPGFAANEAMGFNNYLDDEVVTQGDGVFLLIFVENLSVAAEVALYGQAFYFAESVAAFSREDARFRVIRDEGGVLLVPV